ncbi:MAG TPA: hypothetical protein VEY06_14500 [Flavisolibacter sp.]|nr:hypothetical protein [Flavisolibacter sp.]
MILNNRLRNIRRLLALFIVCLFLSGLTAIPVEWQLRTILNTLSDESRLHIFLSYILEGYTEMATQYPFLVYGYDWLAFAHFVLAILFIGPYRDPVKNIWVIEFGLIACVLVLPYAAVMGQVRGLPVWWRLCDCSFGVVGFALLWIVRKKIGALTKTSSGPASKPVINIGNTLYQNTNF